jgi:hypothetical protein
MQVHVVGKQINRNGVIHGDLHNLIARFDLNVFSFYRNSQVLDNFKDIVANLLFRVAVYNRKARLFLNLVRQLIFRRVGRHDLYRRINRKSQNSRNDESLDFASSTLATPHPWARSRSSTMIYTLWPVNAGESALHTPTLAPTHTSV